MYIHTTLTKACSISSPESSSTQPCRPGTWPELSPKANGLWYWWLHNGTLHLSACCRATTMLSPKANGLWYWWRSRQ